MSTPSSEPAPGGGRLPQDVADRLLDLIGRLPHLVGITDDLGRLRWMNDAGRRFVGAPPTADMTTGDLFTDASFDRYYAEVRPAILQSGTWSGELTVRRGDGAIGTVAAVVVGEAGPAQRIEWLGMLAVDITEQRARENRLSHQASHDPLTGLPNRALLLDRLRIAVSVAARNDASVAVMALDLDGFKDVNDRFGHPAGDQLLQHVTARLAAAVRPTDTVARMGGDEFVVVLHPPDHPAEALEVAERVRSRIAAPGYRIDDTEIRVTASIGLTVAPDARTVDIEQLLTDADRGMYRAKRDGGDRVHHVSLTTAGSSAHASADDAAALARALASGHVRAVFDPIISMDGSEILGCTVRPSWDDPDRGPISAEVLEAATIHGRFGELVWWAATRHAIAHAPTSDDVAIDLTLSTGQLRRDDLVERLGTVRSLAPDANLRVEATVRTLLDLTGPAPERLQVLHDLDVELVLADHGGGDALPIALLASLPIGAVKLAAALVAERRRRPVAVALACQLATALDVHCIAPGVDDADDLLLLSGLGVTAAQGPVTGGPWDAARLASELHAAGSTRGQGATRPRP